MKQDAPFTIQIELAEGCNVHVPRSDGTKGLCEACGLNAIRKGPGDYKFMSVQTAETVAHQIAASGWNSQLLFAMHGEPSMNPYMVEIIGVFRKHLPNAYMVMLTNGGGFIKPGRLAMIFKAGINVVAFDDYDGAGLVERVPFDVAGVPIRHYPSDKDANPHHRTKKQFVVLIDDIKTATKGTHSVLNNHAGSGMAPNKDFWGKKCAKPFREVGVRWDGTVSGCCVDWRNQVEVGNTNQTPLEVLWNGPVFQAMRRILINGDRQEIDLCSGCDHPSYRVGLLPDKFGKQTLPDWTEEDVQTVAAAGRGQQTVVTFFPRKWHKEA
jgi:hypothetical protein